MNDELRKRLEEACNGDLTKLADVLLGMGDEEVLSLVQCLKASSEPVRPALREKGKDLLQEFDEAAKDWGWTRDQGTSGVYESQERYDNAREALRDYIIELEEELEELRAK